MFTFEDGYYLQLGRSKTDTAYYCVGDALLIWTDEDAARTFRDKNRRKIRSVYGDVTIVVKRIKNNIELTEILNHLTDSDVTNVVFDAVTFGQRYVTKFSSQEVISSLEPAPITFDNDRLADYIVDRHLPGFLDCLAEVEEEPAEAAEIFTGVLVDQLAEQIRKPVEAGLIAAISGRRAPTSDDPLAAAIVDNYLPTLRRRLAEDGIDCRSAASIASDMLAGQLTGQLRPAIQARLIAAIQS